MPGGVGGASSNGGPYPVMLNLVAVDKGALTMALNVLDRSDKGEVSAALKDGAAPIEELLELAAKEAPALYMRFVTSQMITYYT